MPIVRGAVGGATRRRSPYRLSARTLDSQSSKPGSTPGGGASFHPDAVVGVFAFVMPKNHDQVLGVGGQGVLRVMELGESLGRGAMGTVYVARVRADAPPGTPPKMAVRVLSSRFHRDPAFISRFYADATAARRLQHPDLVRVLDVAEVGGRHCLAMELAAGETLDKHLARTGKLVEPALIAIGLAVAGALRTAWMQQRLLHHDLRPQNIFMDTGNVVKLADVGLARTAANETGHPLAHTPVSDPHYTAPELALGARAQDCLGDIYALGATLYHLATGAQPFGGRTGPAVFQQQREVGLPWARGLNPALSQGLCAILEKMLGRDPHDRYPAYDTLISDLKTLAAGGRPAEAAIAVGLSVMTRPKSSAVRVVAPAGTPKAWQVASQKAAATPPAQTHHHPGWMTTPVVIAAWIVAFLLAVACVVAYVYRVDKQQQLDEEASSRHQQQQVEDAADAAARSKLAEADDYARRNSGDVAGIVERYERVAEFFFATTAGRTAKDEAAKWRAKLPK